eukprot:9821024-Lingulodinium_polyedra.AAC.1
MASFKRSILEGDVLVLFRRNVAPHLCRRNVAPHLCRRNVAPHYMLLDATAAVRYTSSPRVSL